MLCRVCAADDRTARQVEAAGLVSERLNGINEGPSQEDDGDSSLRLSGSLLTGLRGLPAAWPQAPLIWVPRKLKQQVSSVLRDRLRQAALTAVDEEESPKTSALDMANAEINRLRALAATHHLKLKAIAKTISTIDSMEDVNEKCDAIRVLKNESCRWHVRDANKGHTSLAPMHEYFSAKISGGSGRDVAGAGGSIHSA